MRKPGPPEFTFQITEDGSPSLALGAAGEWMHNARGAFGESRAIYGTALETLWREGWPPRILVVGLGLGYVELIAAATALRNGAAADGLRLLSFESDPRLGDYFLAWIGGRTTEVPAEFAKAYQAIADRTAEAYGVSPAAVTSLLAALADRGHWRLPGPLFSPVRVPWRSSALCFDAFSSQTSPELWEEGFLREFLREAAETDCVLSTYAAKGSLKRALRESGFATELKPGFGGKRQSTFALRRGSGSSPGSRHRELAPTVSRH